MHPILPHSLMAFAGGWRLSREITQHSGGPDGHFSGTADFTRDGEVLRYDEAGLMRLSDGSAMKATRRYLWHPMEGGARITFDDGRAFHQVRFDDPQAVHDCPPDTYRVKYDFSKWPNWQATWHVTGPRKDYTMVSSYAPTSSVVTLEERSKVL